MQTILGANGIIGEELAKELRKKYTSNIKLVGRHPQKIHAEDVLCKADLLDKANVLEALNDTSVAYLTVGLPYTSDVWLRDWVRIMSNVIDGCRQKKCRLVYFDNTYAYPQDMSIQTEMTSFNPNGKKGEGKKQAAELLLSAMAKHEIEAAICRAPEFYGPGKTKSITNSLIFENIKKDKPPKVFLRDDVLRTLIYTPDAGRAMALIGNTTDAYGHTWHLPCDDHRLTYKGFIEEVSRQLGRKIPYTILSITMLKAAAVFNNNIVETMELLPRYAMDNIFDSSRFKARFPEFTVTTYEDGIAQILKEMDLTKQDT